MQEIRNDYAGMFGVARYWLTRGPRPRYKGGMKTTTKQTPGPRDADEARIDATVDGAIRASTTEDRTVHLDARDLGVDRGALCDALAILSDDSADTDARTEYWGADDDGADWRVHVAAEVRS